MCFALTQVRFSLDTNPALHNVSRMTTIILKKGREKSALRRHPWIFSGAIAICKGSALPGETVEVVSSKGQFLGRGAYSPKSQITVRFWSFNADEQITVEFFRRRLKTAIHARQQMLDTEDVNAYRLVNAESDGLPGIIIDRYGDYVVGQFLSAGAEFWKSTIVEQLMDILPVKGFYERSDVAVREKEGQEPASGVLAGESPPGIIDIQEGDLRFQVDIRQGHKTGWYLDQRENRAALSEYVRDADILNCFAYTGGFGIYALKYGAHRIVNIDSSANALELARQHLTLNGFDPDTVEYVQADVFQILRRYRDEASQTDARQFDVIILDPPKFVESRKHLDRACRGYKDINLLAMKLLKPGGILMTYSCSGLLSPELFQKIVADAALDAGRSAQIIRRLFQAADHPVSLNFPEGTYLKGFVCRVE
jgi:23S rRNA (cytosine1962-C5)-methyltransferase